MSKEPRSVIGEHPENIGEILAPVHSALKSAVERPVIEGRRREFLYYQLFDALRAGKAIELLVWGEAQGVDISPESIDVLVRRVVEQAILAAYIAQSKDSASIIDEYLKTTGTEWKQSFGEDVPEAAIPGKCLPKYRIMAEAVGGWLLDDFKHLSYGAHPRGAVPYRLIERQAGISPHDFFVLRVSGSLGRLKSAFQELVTAYEQVDSADP